MDYNFFVAQSRGHVDPRHAEQYKQQMLATYLAYFRTNYTGNRAPLNIGHHFFAYQGGVYDEALEDFARRVCGLPEVKCATYAVRINMSPACPVMAVRRTASLRAPLSWESTCFLRAAKTWTAGSSLVIARP